MRVEVTFTMQEVTRYSLIQSLLEGKMVNRDAASATGSGKCPNTKREDPSGLKWKTIYRYAASEFGMTNDQREEQDSSGVKIRPTGHETGMFGLPGDITPSSRFVRLALMTRFADEPENANKALNLARHIVSSLHRPG